MSFPIVLLVQSPLIPWDLRWTPDAKVRSGCSLRRAGGDLYHLWTAGDSGAATGSQEVPFFDDGICPWPVVSNGKSWLIRGIYTQQKIANFNFHATQSRMHHVGNSWYFRVVLEWQEGQNQLLPRLHLLSGKLGYVATIPSGHTTQIPKNAKNLFLLPRSHWMMKRHVACFFLFQQCKEIMF